MNGGHQPALRVVFCDDAVAFPMLLRLWIESVEGVELVGQAATLDELLGLLEAERVDLVLIDLMLAGGQVTPEVVAGVRTAAPAAVVVLMSSLPGLALEDDRVRVGADLMWPKASGSDGLEAALADALRLRPQLASD